MTIFLMRYDIMYWLILGEYDSNKHKDKHGHEPDGLAALRYAMMYYTNQ